MNLPKIVCFWLAALCFTSWEHPSFGQPVAGEIGNYSNDPSIVREPAYSLGPGAPQSPARQQPSFVVNSSHQNTVPSGTVGVQPSAYHSVNPSKPASTGIALKAPGEAGENGVPKPSNSLGSVLSVVVSLGFVLALFLGLAWVFRKTQPRSLARLPTEVVQVLGRSNLAPRQQMYVVRFGSRLLLISQQPGHTQTLCEITDDEEVDRLAGFCESNSPTSVSQSFTEVVRQVVTGAGQEKVRRRPVHS